MDKINIAELLKDCPQGMELDCTMFDNVQFIAVDEAEKPICIRTEDIYRYLTKFGTWTFDKNAKCVIFPKGKTTWEGFVPPCKFKNGDIVCTSMDSIVILGDRIGEHSESFNSYCGLYNYEFDIDVVVLPERLATAEEKQELFQAIKAKGYRWNTELKTLEKLVEPKFKVGNKVRHKDDKTVITITVIKDDYYFIQYYNSNKNDYQNEKVSFKDQDKYELVPNDFDINTLVPFESKVLVRHTKDNKWCASFFSHIDEDFHSHCYKFVTTSGKSYPYCIPYEGNEHLLGKTDDCVEYFKTWE